MTMLEWNGADLPDELKELPPGRYVVYPAESDFELTPEEDQHLVQALDRIRAGQGVPHEDAVRRLEAALRR